jgi:hypothetical protein
VVEPMGFEPTTFPVSPGRANQLFDQGSILPGLDLALPADSFSASRISFAVNELPWATILQRFRVTRVVIGNALLDVLRLTNVKSAR